MSLFVSLARSLFGLSLSRKIPTELCEHSHAKWRRPEGQNATNIFRLRGKKKDECILKYIYFFYVTVNSLMVVILIILI